MELSQVKAAVKAWEKAFKAANGRDPTKEDIKRDPSDIAEQYALYRQLSKSSSASQSQSQSQSRNRSDKLPPSSSTSASTSTAHAKGQAPRATPRTTAASDYPTTPTPPSRKSSGYTLSRASQGASQAGPSRRAGDRDVGRPGEANGNGLGKSLKRTASRANLPSSPPPGGPSRAAPPAGAPTARALFLTPKKNAYSGPVLDPNPVNPFSIASPSKSPYTSKASAIAGGLGMGSAEKRGKGQESPFIHYTSPKKFKEVLEANSYHRRNADAGSSLGGGLTAAGGSAPALGAGVGITPRTRARKRLRGEPVEDTPVKDRPARRRKGIAVRRERTPEPEFPAMQSGIGFSDEDEDDDDDDDGQGVGGVEEDDDSEDGLGPTPVKGGRGFTNLFDSPVKGMVNTKGKAIAAAPAKGKGKAKESGKAGKGKGKAVDEKQPGIMGFFGRVNKKKEEKDTGKAFTKSKQPTASSSASTRYPPPASPTPIITATPSPSLRTTHLPPASPGSGPISPPPPLRSPTPTAIPEPSPPKSQPRRNKVLALSEDEEDEWDPEGGKIVRRLVIMPTRRAVRRRGSDSLSEGGFSRDGSGAEDGMEEDDRPEEEDIALQHNTFTNSHSGNGHPQSPSLPLTLLSLQSPPPQAASSRRAALESLRVRAIFNPLDAARLRAVKRGQDVHFSGEGGVAGGEGEEGEEEVLERYEAGLAGGGVEGGEEGGGGVEGDDDWESEDDGWKRNEEHLGVEDDW
ncbi:hypothetical protein IAT38_005744 [Cryptococcus sp. DSM 104549]